MISEADRRKLVRNLALSNQLVSSCGYAMRVAVADMLQDFENIRALSESDSQILELLEALEKAVENDIALNRQVFGILGLKIPPN